MSSVAPPRRRRSARVLPGTVLSQGPWIGMRDSLDPTSADPRLATLLQNLYPGSQGGIEGVWGRPPALRISAVNHPGNTTRIQGAYEYVNDAGVRRLIAVAGGQVYRFDGGSGLWTALGTLGMTISTTAPKVYFATFAGLMVVSDGVNRPWTWDGAAAAGTVIANAPVAYGRPAVYYAKLFFIKAGERNAIVWSEEGDPYTGYEAAPYANVWALVQTRRDALTAILGTNEGLYYWRSGATGLITGAVSADFSTTGTDEGISDTTGTESPDSIVRVGRAIFLIDEAGHPQMLVGGSYVQAPPIWHDARETTRRIPRATLPQASGVYVEALELVVFALADFNTSGRPSLVLAFHAITGQFIGVWTGWVPSCFCTYRDSEGKERVGFGGHEGGMFRLGDVQGTAWDDDGVAVGSSVPIQHIVQASAMGWSTTTAKLFTLFAGSVRYGTAVSGVTCSFVLPGREDEERTVSYQGGGMALWDDAEWDLSDWPSDTIEGRVLYGLSREGRYIIPRLTHKAAGEEFGVLAFTVDAQPLGTDHGGK